MTPTGREASGLRPPEFMEYRHDRYHSGLAPDNLTTLETIACGERPGEVSQSRVGMGSEELVLSPPTTMSTLSDSRYMYGGSHFGHSGRVGPLYLVGLSGDGLEPK